MQFPSTMTAATLLIQHGHGKPVDRKVVAELAVGEQGRPVEHLTQEELLRIAAAELS